MSTWKTRRRTALRALAGAALTAALVAPAATAVAATPAGDRTGTASATTKAQIGSVVRTQKLVDGSTAVITKRAAHHYVARIVHGGYVYATLEANQRDAAVKGNGMFVVLTFDGEMHSWVGGGMQGPGTFSLPGGSTAEVTKVGDHHYIARIIHRGYVYATLEANKRDAGVNGNGLFLVLTFDGELSASVR